MFGSLSDTDGDVTERTPLMQRTSSPRSYTGQDFLAGAGILQASNSSADDATNAFYRRIFLNSGTYLEIEEVTLIHCHPVNRWLPRVFAPRVICQSVSASWPPGGLHAVVDVDGVAARTLLKAASGETHFTTGDIRIDGCQVDSTSRKHIGVVSHNTAAVPNLSVGRNLRFVIDMRSRGTADWKKTMVEVTAKFAGLDLRNRVDNLSVLENFKLRVAMELILDPPVLMICNPFADLDYVSQAHCSHFLHHLCTVLQKTVIVATTTLAPKFFDLTNTMILFGVCGQVLYSGLSSDMCSYFTQLRVPSHQEDRDGENYRLPNTLELQQSTWVRPQDLLVTNLPSEGAAISHVHRHQSSPSRISHRMFEGRDGIRTPTPRNDFVIVHNGEDALDLAVEWADSTVQTLYFAAKYYDSDIHAQMAGALQNRRVRALEEDIVDAITATWSHSILKPWILMRYMSRQLLSELMYGTTCCCVGIATVSLLIHTQPKDQGGMYNTRGILFILFMLVMLINEVTMYDTRSQLKLFVHHRYSGLYSTPCFTLCLIVRIAVVRAFYLVFFFPFVLTVVKSSRAVVVLVGIVSVVHATLLYASHAAASQRLAPLLCHAYFAFSLICSGYLLNLQSIPRICGQLSVLRWGYGPALRERLSDNPFSCDGTGNTSYCYRGNDYLSAQGLMNDTISHAWLTLSTMMAALLAIMVAALALR